MAAWWQLALERHPTPPTHPPAKQMHPIQEHIYQQPLSSPLTELLVNLILHRQTVAVPPKAACDVVSRAAGIARHNVLQHRGGAAVESRWAAEGKPSCWCSGGGDGGRAGGGGTLIVPARMWP